MDSKEITEDRYNVIMKMLHSIAQKEGITNSNIELFKGCEKGDGYIGEKSMAIISGDNRLLELFIKAAPTNSAFKEAMDPRPMYLQEIHFYKDIYPKFNEFQTRKNIPKPFTSVIGCVETCSEKDHEILILQNARNLGFELCDRKKQMNPQHVEFVYNEYGKFHGLSYALKDQEPKVYQHLIDGMPVDILTFLKDNMTQSCIDMHEIAKAQFDPIKDAKYYNAYSKFIEYMPQFLQQLIDEKDKFSVIIHGDCWCTNMMFKYPPNSDKSCPRKMCLLDFQVIGQGTPVMDLSFFTYASSPKEVYNNLDHYLKVYHESLSKTVRDLGSPHSAIPTFEELKDLWKVYGKYGIMVSIITLKICVQDKDEIQDISEVLEESGGKDIMAGFFKTIKNEDLFHERLKNIIVHAVKNEFI